MITGGSRGLGKAIAAKLVGKKTVVICAPHEEPLEAVARELNCEYEVCDITHNADIEQAVARVIARHGKIDCLVNNAGIWSYGELDAAPPQEIKTMMEVNVMGMMLVSRLVIPHMKKRAQGLIVNIGSQAGLRGRAERTLYGASKWAVTGFTKSLQLELAPHGIRVTAIYPGKLNTGLIPGKKPNTDMTNALNTDEVAKMIEFILELDPATLVMGVEISHIKDL